MESNSRVNEGVTIGNGRINHLLFADYFVLLPSSERGLQHALDRSSATCDDAEMKICAGKTEVLCPKPVNAASERN